MSERRAYRASEIADMFGVSTGWVRARIKSGDLPSFRVGAVVFVPAAAVEDLLRGEVSA